MTFHKTNSIRRMASVPGRASITKTNNSRYLVSLILFAAASSFWSSSAQNFSVPRTSYACASNVICLGGAHVYTGYDTSTLNVGMLSLISEVAGYASQTTGIVYYVEPVRLLDPSSHQSASFSTSFEIEVVNNSARTDNGPADGMAFVISADNLTLGNYGRTLGVFNAAGYTTFKTIVVEFDEYDNGNWPTYDINDNHISFDFSNITSTVVADAGDANVKLGEGQTTYAWVDYSADTQQLEVRISNNNVRPTDALLTHAVDLFNVVEEYMWIGFSSGASFAWSNYYIGNWTFQSYGIPAASPYSDLPPSQVPGPGQSHTNWTIVGIIGSVAFVLGCILSVVAVMVFQHFRSSGRGWLKVAENKPLMQLDGMPERLNYEELFVATGGFSKESKLGEGGFGSVYRGVLSSGIPVAVKKINSDSTQGEKEFMAEVSIISQLRHRNLIELLGWCKDASRGDYLLVYELMPNGSLDKALFGTLGPTASSLSWAQRFKIVTGAAAALDYLHQGWKQLVIHRDIKPSNILLDEHWNARLGDFGLARFVDHEREATTTLVAGTYGYIAPEVASSGRFTDKTDVFAFGAVVLEVACGRKALSARMPEDEMALVDWVWQCRSRGDLLSTVDKRLCSYDEHSMEILLNVGLLCSHPNPLARPTMKHVIQILAGDAPLPYVPMSKPVPVYCSDSRCASPDDESTQETGYNSSYRSLSISMLPKDSDSTIDLTVKSGNDTSSSRPSSYKLDSSELSNKIPQLSFST